jgi:hypothetical protein
METVSPLTSYVKGSATTSVTKPAVKKAASATKPVKNLFTIHGSMTEERVCIKSIVATDIL